MQKFILRSSVLLLSLSGLLVPSFAQAQTQQIKITVNPRQTIDFMGVRTFERQKHINLAANVNEIEGDINTESSRFDEYFNDLEMHVGRRLNLVKAEYQWGKSVREDKNRPGYADLDYMKKKCNPDEAQLDVWKPLFGDRQDLALHDAHNTYPEFIGLYGLDDAGGQKFPKNNKAAGELAANLLKYAFTDFTRPSFYEPVNEPHWRYGSTAHFCDHHVQIKNAVDQLGLDVQVGGPCFSVSYFYKNEYKATKQMVEFMKGTDFKLDFYSFHTYDYMRWNKDEKKFTGAITSGLPLEGVFDALASYTYNQFGRTFKYVASEHGGYLSNKENRLEGLNYLADTYFPGKGFNHEIKKRSIENFLMVNSAIGNTMAFMDNPHIVNKSVPFILLESSKWDPKYYASLLVKDNFDKKSEFFTESKLIDFYKFFEDVRGRRVVMNCADNDIQHFAYVDGKKLIMLFHNLSEVDGEIDIDLSAYNQKPRKMRVRRLGREDKSFLPFMKKEKLKAGEKLHIGPQQSIALFVTYKKEIEEDQTLKMHIDYAKTQNVQFKGARTFQMPCTLKKKEVAYAQLRVGINRKHDFSKEVHIFLNGTKLDTPVPDCAPTVDTAKSGYTTTHKILVPVDLLRRNNQVKVAFADGKAGGVGAVVLRTLRQ